MLSFRVYENDILSGPYSVWRDRQNLLKGKTAGWTKEEFEKAGFRMVPNSPVRKGSFIGKDAVLMPCYVNEQKKSISVPIQAQGITEKCFLWLQKNLVWDAKYLWVLEISKDKNQTAMQ